jgi:polar amino acid transport system substrate-binding protein
MATSLDAARADLAPTGRLRVGINFGNVLLTAKDPVTGAAKGIAVDLGYELGQRLGVPVDILGYATPGDLAEAVTTGVWDVGFLGDEPARAKVIDFTASYVEIEATYMVPPGSPITKVEDVDKPGIRVGIPQKSAYDLYLTRTLKHAELLRGETPDAAFKRFVDEKLDVLAGLRPRLQKDNANMPGSKILDGRFTAVQQAVGTPKGRAVALAYLREFVEDAKASGLIDRLIGKHKVRGLTISAPAPL